MNSRNIPKNEQKNHFKNLKSDYILRNIIGLLKTKKSFEIVRYNKKLQKRLDISINDYRKLSKIEIELTLTYSEYGNLNNHFINIDEPDKEYYHIYFDNLNEEIKRTYLKENEKIEKIKIIIDYQVKSLQRLFYDCNRINSISFKKFLNINITNMSHMFYGCSSLKELDLSNFKTNNVNYMDEMFSHCRELKELNLSKFNTNNVTNMSHMFFCCLSLKELNLSNFNTNKVTNMSGMFRFCSSLKKLNISNFNTYNVTNVSYMFFGCSALKELNLSKFNINNVIHADNMLTGCSDEFINKIKSLFKE